MRSFLKKIFSKLTVFLVLCSMFILLGLPIGIHGLTLKGGSSLGGGIILFGVFIVFILLVFDRIAVSKLPQKQVNVFELVLLVLGILFFSFQQREIIIDLSDKKTEYFVLLENNGKLDNSETKYSFPFNKKLIYKGKIAVINSIKDNYQRLNLKSPKDWKSQRMQPWSTSNYKLRFYSNGNKDYNESEVDSLILSELNTLE